MSIELKLVEKNACQGGWHERYSHFSEINQCDMTFAIYLPPQAAERPVPVIYWLSGLTCNEQNFMQKAGALRYAAAAGVAIVAPDTSPRGDNVPDEADSWELGKGAGFYVNATQEPWADNYNMYDYVTIELPGLIETRFNVTDQRSIFGHSMGGHGALVCALRHPENYASVSAFSPITNPINTPWGKKAFSQYLGENTSNWKQYDATELMMGGPDAVPLLIDQGDADEFLEAQLQADAFLKAAADKKYRVTYHLQPGYDHSYFFVSSFIKQHIRFHSKFLNKDQNPLTS